MSSSYNTEEALRDMGNKLCGEGYHLIEAADLLQKLRENKQYREEIKDLKERFKNWM